MSETERPSVLEPLGRTTRSSFSRVYTTHAHHSSALPVNLITFITGNDERRVCNLVSRLAHADSDIGGSRA